MSESKPFFSSTPFAVGGYSVPSRGQHVFTNKRPCGIPNIWTIQDILLGFFSGKLKLSCVILASALLSISFYFNQQLQASLPETIGEIQAKSGRFMIFPFTQYGPNNQLLGLRQALSFCRVLDVPCIEPGFSDHFMHHAYRLGDFYNISDLHLVPRSSLSSPLKPDVFVYGETNKGPRWPGKSYFQMHNISYQQEPSQEDENNYAKTVLGSSNKVKSTTENIKWTLVELQKELISFLKQPPSNRSDRVVALVYPALFSRGVDGYIPPEPLITPYMEVFDNFRPKDSLVATAEQLIETLFPGGEQFLAVHLRLQDNCKTTIEECCCETSGSMKHLTNTEIEHFIDFQRNKFDVRYVFISAPPSLQRMAEHWNWAIDNADTIKFWYSDTAPGSHEESLLQQIICSKAAAFFYSNPSSTWGITMMLWQRNGTITEELVKL